MSIIGRPINSERTKFCFVYCGPERCDCGATNIEFETIQLPVEEKKTITLEITASEINALYELVSRYRSRTNMLKQLHDINVSNQELSTQDLNNLFAKLSAVKVDNA